MRSKIRTTAIAIAVLLLAVNSASSKTKDKCFKVRCRGTSGICISYGGSGGAESGIPGVAETTEIPCPSSGSILMPPFTYYGAIFIHDPSDPSQGVGYTNADVEGAAAEAGITTYDDTQQYSSFQSWQNALP
jgi:hypothetical protein